MVNKTRTYADKLLSNQKFRKAFEKEYKSLIISEKIAELRHKAHLTQEELARRIQTTKSAISRYESNGYAGYSVSLLERIAVACGAELEIGFIVKKGK